MKVYKIEATPVSPAISLDPDQGKFLISGDSRPEDARGFYQPVLDWLDEYHALRYWKSNTNISDVDATVFEFKFEYINSTSAKYLLDILHKIRKFQDDDMSLKIKWYYDAPDQDMKESGEMFENMVGIPFEHIAVI